VNLAVCGFYMATMGLLIVSETSNPGSTAVSFPDSSDLPLVRPLALEHTRQVGYWYLFVMLAGSLALFWWRQQHPVRLLAVALVLDAANGALFGTSIVFLTLFGLFAVAQRAGAKAIWWGGAATGLVWFAVDVAFFAGRDMNQRLFNLVALAAVVALLAQMGNRRRYVMALRESAWHLAQERDQRAKVAVAEERERISREMHDVVAHSVAVMVTLSDGAAAAVERSPSQARQAMEKVSETGRQAVSDMRRLLAVLRSDVELTPQPGAIDLFPLVASFQESGLPVVLELKATLPANASAALAVYRIVQESLTNVLRHAPGTPWVKVLIDQPDPPLYRVVVENGPPVQVLSPAQAWDGSGQGVAGMRQRARVFDGDLEAGPTPSGGWKVTAWLKEEP
jgi:signal transduction histidine kinase